MPDFELIASTLRGGFAVDEVAFEVTNASGIATAATGYLVGRRLDGPQPIVLALHHERGDKSTLLTDLEHLAGRGFLGMSIDSPMTRRASADRDPLTAFMSQFDIAQAALQILQADPGVHAHKLALLGRGLGGEVAASIAARSNDAQVVTAIEALPDRSAFVQHSPHPIAAGLRLFGGDAEMLRQAEALAPHRLLAQLEQPTTTHWLLQIADDDDRLSEQDRAAMTLSIPPTVRVDHVARAQDLYSHHARRDRVDFISHLCG